MSTTINRNDWMDTYHAWKALDGLLNAKGLAEVAEAMEEVTPEIRDRLMEVVNKLHVLAEGPPAPARKLRFPRRDTTFTNLMNIACYRFVMDDEARMLRGDKRRPPIPYGVEDTSSLRMKIENYRWSYTHMVRGFGMDDKPWATKTIWFFYEFSPSEEELDEAAAYYTANPE